MRIAGITEARRIARAWVHRLGITAPEHIRIQAIARRLGARVVVTRLDGADAQLVRNGHEVVINVSDRLSVGTPRFPIAHELGHFVLGHPTMPPYLLSAPVSRPVSDNERDYEAEANAFASELVMPHRIVHPWCEALPVSLEVPWRISREFSMTILSSTIRLIELSSHRCAAVFSSNRRVVWVRRSETFTREIENGRPLDPDSVAWDFWQNGSIAESASNIPAGAWFETAADVEIIEHATCSPAHGTVLSLLWIPEPVAAPLGMVAEREVDMSHAGHF